MGEQSIKTIANIIILAVVFAIAICSKFVVDGNKEYILGIIFFVIIGFAVSYIKKKLLIREANESFKSQWGREDKRKRNFKSLEKVFNFILGENDKEFYIDNQTWDDITMNELFSKIDRTITSVGEEMLYKMLRMPSFQEEKLIKRNKIIKLFESNKEIREKVGMELIKVGKSKQNDVPELLWTNIQDDNKLAIIVNALNLLAVASIISVAIFRDVRALMLIALSIGVNTIVHYKFKQTISFYVSSLGYLNSIMKSAEAIGKIKCEALEEYKLILNEASKKCIKVTKKTRGLNRIEGIDVLADYVYIAFLVEERKYFGAINDIKKCREELKNLYINLGNLDALLSIASYRSGLKNYVEPRFVDDSEIFEAKDLIHPLIENAVANSVSMNNKGIILTGTNMSGKSTFLRTIAVNALLAQTIYTCCASYYRASFFKIMTSISPEDNLLGGKSYYFREAEALKRIIEQCNDTHPLLCIVDEIFRGTNPVERVNASAEILSYIDKHNTLTVVATHDLELTEILKDKYECCYFSEDITEDGLNFDYKLKHGVCRTRNAVKLLKFLNYPEEIIENTNKRIQAGEDL